MVTDSQQILREVRTAANLDEVLSIIVRRVRASLRVDVCAIHLTGAEVGQYVLMASAGSSSAATGEIRSGPQAGLAPRRESPRIGNSRGAERQRVR